jgi:hypothetical protein
VSPISSFKSDNGNIGLHGEEYACVWDISDYDNIFKLFKLIRQSARDRDFYKHKFLVEGFNDKLSRVYNDQTVRNENDFDLFEPIQIVKSNNKIVNDGLVRIAELVTGTLGLSSGGNSIIGSGLWTHIACGIGDAPVSASDFQLHNELARVSLATDGFQSAAGSVMRFGGFFPPTTQSSSIQEAGCFDDPSGGTMFFRTVYDIPIVHLINDDFFSVAHNIYQTSV